MTNKFERQVKGLLGTKLGMTQVWDEDGKFVPVTVVKADSNVVTQIRNQETDGYEAVQIGFGAIDSRKVTKPLAGHFEKAGVTPRRHIVELRTADASEYSLGQELTVELFEAGQKVDVVGKTKGKGFAGYEASRLQGCWRVSRSAQEPPQARFHRWRILPRTRVQGYAHGWPYGRSTSHYLEPDYPGCGRREQCPADQGRNPRSQGRRCSGSYRCEGA